MPGSFAVGDPVARGRTSFDAFRNSDLEQLLVEAGVRHLLIGGFITDQCVAKTLRTALVKGYDAYLLTQASATFSAAVQARVERRFAARALTHRQALSRLAAA